MKTFIKTQNRLVNLEHVTIIKKYGERTICIFHESSTDPSEILFETTHERDVEFERLSDILVEGF